MTSVREGIYIEIKKGKVGTGSTAKPAEFRNFYLVRPSGDMVETVLLTDKLQPTGIIEHIMAVKFDSTWRHEPRLDKYVAAISSKVPTKPAPKPPAPEPAAKPTATAPAAKSQPVVAKPKPKETPAKDTGGEKPWWEAGGSGKKLF